MFPELKPIKRPTAYSLVEQAGLDVTVWANYARPNVPSANPTYCYNWVWRQGDRILATVWYRNLESFQGKPCTYHNLRGDWVHETANWAHRASQLDQALAYAFDHHINVQVMIVDGESGDRRRMLDHESWHVDQYDHKTGKCRLVRGPSLAMLDQFDVAEAEVLRTERGKGFSRDPAIRKAALIRARGVCQLCDTAGFIMANGNVYLESHHIVALGEGGADSLGNVVALCPTCHAKAHHGIDRAEVADQLRARIGVPDPRIEEKARFQLNMDHINAKRMSLLRRKSKERKAKRSGAESSETAT